MQRHHHPSLPPWPLPPVPLVHKNAPYVRSLHVENPTVLLREFVAPALGCCLLTSLSVSHTADLEAVLAILQRAANTLKSFTYRSTLRVSELNLQSDSSRLSRQLWTVLPACQALTHLKITSAGIPKECHEAFFQVCERLSSLSLIHTLFAQEQSHQEPATEERSEESIVIQRLCKTQFPNLKTMVLLNNSISSARQVAFIQQAAPSLKSLTWKTSSRFYTRCLASCLVEHGVQLTKLDVSLSVLSDSQLTRILIHLPQLDSLDAQSTGFGPRAAQVLLEHRAAQLQELNIKGCIDVEGRWMQLLLEACPRLRRFLCEYIDIRLILASLEKPSGGWASRELVELGISVSGLTTLDEPMIGMEKLLSQIAVMTKLEILDLVVNNNTKIVALNLDPGSVFSRQLGGLKKIRQVMLQGCQQPMTRATLDFLVQQWPRLEKVGFVFHSGEVNVDRARYQELDSYLAFTHPHLSRAQRQRKTCLFEDKATLPAAAV
ncbi:hypothetical protein BGX31_006589 [Mortierella sp. GBA43]|nr:hypothetical protein BGX31_006589 [Mortierella sp. GBA43]